MTIAEHDEFTVDELIVEIMANSDRYHTLSGVDKPAINSATRL